MNKTLEEMPYALRLVELLEKGEEVLKGELLEKVQGEELCGYSALYVMSKIATYAQEQVPPVGPEYEAWVSYPHSDISDVLGDYFYLRDAGPVPEWYDDIARECLEGGFDHMLEAALAGVPINDICV